LTAYISKPSTQKYVWKVHCVVTNYRLNPKVTEPLSSPWIMLSIAGESPQHTLIYT